MGGEHLRVGKPVVGKYNSIYCGPITAEEVLPAEALSEWQQWLYGILWATMGGSGAT